MNTIKVLLIISLFCVFLKGWTVIVRRSEDPTISIALKANPFSENVLINYAGEFHGGSDFRILWSDENEAFLEDELLIIYKIPLIVYLFIFILLLHYYIQMKKKKTGQKEPE